jgi:membrane-bound lytic murein transglycosylase D
LAVVEVLKNPAAYGIEIPQWQDSAYFASLDVSQQLDMRKLESLSAEMRSLNSQYIQLVTYPQSGTEVLVPMMDEQRLQQELATRGELLRAQYARYQVRNGDTLGVIAERHRVNLGALMSLNDLRGHLIHPGDNLLIPISVASQPRLAQASDDGSLRIRVRRGDSLSVIAERYDMRLSELIALSQLSGTNALIYPDQELLVQAPDRAGDPLLYRVSSGDSLWIIANRFNIMLDDLLTWNSLHGREVIYPGQQLAIWTN